MKLTRLTAVNFVEIEWNYYDVIFLASGFEARSIYVLGILPTSVHDKCVALGFATDTNELSRKSNDAAFNECGIVPFVASTSADYEAKIRETLVTASVNAKGQPLKVFVDYSVMTRSWYGYMLTWLKYSADIAAADIDFAYCQGKYHGEFDPLHIQDLSAVQGFEGGCAGSRRTVAFYGLGYDRYATLAVHEHIEPDRVVCYVARESTEDPRSAHVVEQNSEIIEISGFNAVYVPLGDIKEAFRILYEQFTEIPQGDEVVAVPMGPKTHVLATMMVAQFLPRVTCLHARGTRETPIQVTATGDVSIWRADYR